MKTITGGELIEILENFPYDTVVGLSSDSEGNEYSLIPNDYFLWNCYTNGELGTLEYVEDKPIDDNNIPTLILFPSN